MNEPCKFHTSVCPHSYTALGASWCGHKDGTRIEDLKRCPKKPKTETKRTGKSKDARKHYSLHVANHPELFKMPFKELE